MSVRTEHMCVVQNLPEPDYARNSGQHFEVGNQFFKRAPYKRWDRNTSERRGEYWRPRGFDRRV